MQGMHEYTDYFSLNKRRYIIMFILRVLMVRLYILFVSVCSICAYVCACVRALQQ